MARVLNQITLSNPTSDPNIGLGGTFAFDGTPVFSGNGSVTTYSFQWQYNRNSAGWVACATSGSTGITVTSNPYVGNSPNANLNTGTAQQDGTYSVRIVGDPAGGTSYTVISGTQTVTVTGPQTYTEDSPDYINVSDLAIRSALRGRLVTDPITGAIYDGGVTKTYGAVLSDVLALIDGFSAGGITRTKTSSDTLTVSDAVAAFAVKYRLTSDQIEVLDGIINNSPAGGTTYTETIDSFILSVIDGGWRKTATVDIAEYHTAGDEQLGFSYRGRTLSDSLLTADEARRYVRLFRLTSEQLTTLDNYIKDYIPIGGQTHTKELNSFIAAVIDTGKIAETIHTVSMGDQTIAPTDEGWLTTRVVDAADSVASLSDTGWALREWAVFVDDAPLVLWDEEFHDYIPGGTGPQTYTKTRQSTVLDVTDQIDRYRRLNRAVASTVTVTDAVLAQALRNKLASDAISLVDAILPAASRTRLASDAISLADSSSRWILRTRFSDEALAVIDDFDKSLLGTYFEIAESKIAVTDSSGRVVYRTRSITDATSLYDELQSTAYHNATTTDSLTLTDALIRYLMNNRQVSDAITVIDHIVSDWIPAGGYYARIKGSEIMVIDQLLREVWSIRVQGDAITLTEAVVASAHRHRTNDEVLTIVDALLSSAVRNRAVSEYISIADESLFYSLRSRLISELATVSDSASAGRVLNRILADAISLFFDEPIGVVSGDVVLTKSSDNYLLITDSLLRSLRVNRYLSDALYATDYMAKSVDLLRSDSLTVADQTFYSKTFGHVASDGLAVSDDALKFLHRLAVLSDQFSVSDGGDGFDGGFSSGFGGTRGILTARILARNVLDLFDVSDNHYHTFISGLVGLIDVRVMLAVSTDTIIKLGTQSIITVGVNPPRITLGAYN